MEDKILEKKNTIIRYTKNKNLTRIEENSSYGINDRKII